MKNSCHYPIDIVIPWVDDSDKKWLSEKSKYLASSNEDDRDNRYRDWGLLKYWFRGIDKYLPWINKVFFVTYGHYPDWLNLKNDKLVLVKHSDYIPKKYLPVFSSHPIELNYNRIDELSEHFIVFNDDIFVINKMCPNDFFVEGKPVDVVAEVPFRFYRNGIDHIIANDISVINDNFVRKNVLANNFMQWYSLKNKRALFKNLYMLPIRNGFSAFENPHLTYCYLKSIFDEVWEKEPDILDKSSSHRFRSNEDVNQLLFRYWQFASGNFVQSSGQNGVFCSIGSDDELISKVFLDRKYSLICLSDDSLDVDFEKEKEFLIGLFELILPEKSSFEV